MARSITSPEAFFGFKLGSDKKLARWDKIVEYFNLLAEQSDKIKVINLGNSTEGNPFLLTIVSSAENLRNLEHLRQINAKISDPRGLPEKEVASLINEGKAVIFQTMSIHGTEVGGTQMSPELTYDLLTREDEETKRILDNVISLTIPCFNPDGQILVTDWYNKWLGTEYEGCGIPWLYHKYTGHDNNRDAFQTNLPESQHAAKVMYQDWHPQAYQDHHHAGVYQARLYVAPFCEPIHPHADPLIWRENSWFGAHIAYRLEEAGKAGVLNAAQYAAWKDLGWVSLGNYHNMTCLLSESACAKLATPIYIESGQLKGANSGTLRGFPEYKAQTNFPNPWNGGWWRLRDIVEQQKIAAWALLDLAARHRETVLRNAYLKAKRQTERALVEGLFAYIIPAKQHDVLTKEKLIGKLLLQGVEIQKAAKEFTVNNVIYGASSYVISLEQPKAGLLKTLLGRTFYPDNPWTREEDGSPSRPFDSATDTMAEFMGVDVIPVHQRIEAELKIITGIKTSGIVRSSATGDFIFNGNLNDSYKAANILLQSGSKLWRTTELVQSGGHDFVPGSFVVRPENTNILKKTSRETGVDFVGLDKSVIRKQEIKPLRIGVYQRHWGGNMDEGWTRWVLEQFYFPYTSVTDEIIKNGKLRDSFDVIILPNDPIAFITGEKVEEWWKTEKRFGALPNLPPEYRTGIGETGTNAVKEFVQQGGSLVALNESFNFCVEKLGIKVKNTLTFKPKEFFCPGSTLKVKVNNTHPLGYGMPEDTLVLFWNSPAFEILPSDNNEDYEVVARYPQRDILQSGWLIGEDKIAEKIAMLSVKYGKGRVILTGFRTQHRGQTHGTFKFLFNSLIS
jgi:hypothetical protein